MAEAGMAAMTAAFWNAQLQNALTVPDFEAWPGRFATLSAAASQYGEAERRTTGPDPMQALWRTATGRADVALIFIHGGYWRRFAAADFAFVAATAAAADATFYNVDYRLMPAVRLAEVVDDTLKACALALEHASRAVIVGHSAGAHLAVEAACRLSVPPSSVVAISGLYELDPLRYAFIQDELGLTEEEVANYSPQHRPGEPRCPVHLVAGADETFEFQRQSVRLHEAVTAAGGTTTLTFAAGHHHMSVIAELADPAMPTARSIIQRLA